MSVSDGDIPARVRIKICGITRVQDAQAACESGADAIGLVFYAHSPRAVDIVTAQSILHELPPFISVVGLFVDAGAEDVRKILDVVPLDILQFHGSEKPDYCGQFARPYFKAIRMQEGIDLLGMQSEYSEAKALLLDTYIGGIPGGTGRTFDWSQIPADMEKPLILAGGLDSTNVRAAIEKVKPYAVDVSGGVESRKGIKDRRKIAEFIREVNNAHR